MAIPRNCLSFILMFLWAISLFATPQKELFKACRTDNWERFSDALKSGATLRKRNRNGNTCLHLIARQGYDKLLKRILEQKEYTFKINAQNYKHETPLDRAKSYQKDDVILLLQQYGAKTAAELPKKNETGREKKNRKRRSRETVQLLGTPRRTGVGASERKPETLIVTGRFSNSGKLVIGPRERYASDPTAGGARVKSTTIMGLCKSPNDTRHTLQIKNRITEAIEKGESVNSENDAGKSLLYLSCLNGNYTVAQALLENGADVNVGQVDNQKQVAIEKDDISISKIVNSTPLHAAVLKGHIDIVELLLKQPGLNIDQTNQNNVSSFHLATKRKQEKIATLLLEKGCNVISIDDQGISTLHSAAEMGSPELMEKILTHKTFASLSGKAQSEELNRLDLNKQSPLSIASNTCNTKMVTLLLKFGASTAPVSSILIEEKRLKRRSKSMVELTRTVTRPNKEK